jgi:DNA polymerase-3 subunit alpha
MPHDTVFRAAFILESVQVRISAKTQKKFAILIISDGVESFELPLWSELFEEKSHLLKENQLLYAVLQIEKKDEELRLSCRWLDDLTQANEAMVEACDQAYDKAKHQVAKFAQHKSQGAAKSTSGLPKAKEGADKPAVKEKVKARVAETSAKAQGPLIVQIDAEIVKLSHILKLKRTFEEHRGDVPVQVDFLVKNQAIATIHIEAKWGVTVTPELHDALRSQTAVLHK